MHDRPFADDPDPRQTHPPVLVCLHADGAVLVFDKPAGLLSVPGRGPDKQDCLSARAGAHWPDARVVHRLDMSTSGLMLMARGPAAQRRLGDAFAGRRVDKRYVAWVDDPTGRLTPVPPDAPPEAGWSLIDRPIAADWPNRPRQRIDASGRASQTCWRCVAVDRARRRARLELQPLTGRAHQLRVHLASIGHAIVGDALYAPTQGDRAQDRLLLHAWRLGLAHPDDGRPLAFESPPPF